MIVRYLVEAAWVVFQDRRYLIGQAKHNVEKGNVIYTVLRFRSQVSFFFFCLNLWCVLGSESHDRCGEVLNMFFLNYISNYFVIIIPEKIFSSFQFSRSKIAVYVIFLPSFFIQNSIEVFLSIFYIFWTSKRHFELSTFFIILRLFLNDFFFQFFANFKL